MTNVRNKGNSFERRLRKKWRESKLFPKCETARYASKMVDDSGVDFVYTEDLQIQAKSYSTRPDYHKLITEMPTGNNVVVHEYTEKVNVSFRKKGIYAIMTLELFEKLLNKYYGRDKD
jgi:hypothetical protein